MTKAQFNREKVQFKLKKFKLIQFDSIKFNRENVPGQKDIKKTMSPSAPVCCHLCEQQHKSERLEKSLDKKKKLPRGWPPPNCWVCCPGRLGHGPERSSNFRRPLWEDGIGSVPRCAGLTIVFSIYVGREGVKHIQVHEVHLQSWNGVSTKANVRFLNFGRRFCHSDVTHEGKGYKKWLRKRKVMKGS